MPGYHVLIFPSVSPSAIPGNPSHDSSSTAGQRSRCPARGKNQELRGVPISAGRPRRVTSTIQADAELAEERDCPTTASVPQPKICEEDVPDGVERRRAG